VLLLPPLHRRRLCRLPGEPAPDENESLEVRVFTVEEAWSLVERDELRDVVEAGVRDLGHLDTVVANAGILPMAMGDPQPMDFVDAVDVDLVGVMNAVAVSLPVLPDGASIVVTGSTAGMMPGTTDNPAMGPGSAGYGWAKRVLISYTEQMALHLAPRFIRVNCIHPTNCNTHLIHNEMFKGEWSNELDFAMLADEWYARPAST